jgi:hypothetical protein
MKVKIIQAKSKSLGMKGMRGGLKRRNGENWAWPAI